MFTKIKLRNIKLTSTQQVQEKTSSTTDVNNKNG